MAKPTSKAITKWDEELAKQATIASKIVEGIGGTSNFITLASGRMKYKGNEVPQNEICVIVIDHILEHDFYEGDYDPDNPASPVCFAFGRTKDEMRPHEKSHSPQHQQCTGCPQNEWGSADKGRGKACQNRLRLALIVQGDLENAEKAEVAYLRTPVTSSKAWAGYVQNIAGVLKRPPLGVITKIKVVPDDKTQFRLEFSLVDKIAEKYLDALMKKKEAVEKQIDAPYEYLEAEAKPSKGKKGKAAKAAKF